jgi:predicted O-methyltransferase YrrM
MTAVIDEIYESSRVVDDSGNELELHSHIDRAEGEFLAGLIREDPAVIKTLEVGCAYGLSSLFICSALSGREGARHVVVDPFQYERWNGVGVANIERAGVDFFELVKERSEFALPRLAASEAGTFDLVFIDGWHTFDHRMLDTFYGSRLIRVGGYIVVDDCGLASVSKVITYVSSYPCYRIHSQVTRKGSVSKRKLARLLLRAVGPVLPKALHDRLQRESYPSMVALQKIAEDERNWDWFKSF